MTKFHMTANTFVMTSAEIRSSHVKVPNGDLQVPAYLTMPVDEGSYPGIVVIQEIFGVNEHIRDVTERIAREGYVAIAPAIFHRVAPNFEVGYSPQDVELGRKYKQQTKADELLSDIQATIDYLKDLPQVRKDGFGCIGFCFGGHVAYLAATLRDIQATASFYGAGITSQTPGGGSPTITRTPEISGTIYAFFGMQDASIPAKDVDQIEAELKKYQVSHKIFRYAQADHGFFCDRRASYNPEAAADAWEHVKQLFQQHLKEA
nr:dienelactone hydrolase family protein [Chroococcidiopsis sp. TS-821]